MIFTIPMKCWARLSKFGCPYGEVRLTLTVGSFRVVAHFFHSIKIFHFVIFFLFIAVFIWRGETKRKYLKSPWNISLWKVEATFSKAAILGGWVLRAAIETSNFGHSELSSKYLFCKILPLLEHDAISERRFHEAMNIIFCLCYGLLFLPHFVIKQQ